MGKFVQDTGEFNNLFKMRWELQSCEGVNMVKSNFFWRAMEYIVAVSKSRAYIIYYTVYFGQSVKSTSENVYSENILMLERWHIRTFFNLIGISYTSIKNNLYDIREHISRIYTCYNSY